MIICCRITLFLWFRSFFFGDNNRLESSSPFSFGVSISSCSDFCLCLLLFLGLVATVGVSSRSELDLRVLRDLLGEPLSGDGVFSFTGWGEGDFRERLGSGEVSSTT